MTLELFYVIRKYTYGAKQKLEKPVYAAGPFSSIIEAHDFISGNWYNKDCFVIATQTITVKEL